MQKYRGRGEDGGGYYFCLINIFIIVICYQHHIFINFSFKVITLITTFKIKPFYLHINLIQ